MSGFGRVPDLMQRERFIRRLNSTGALSFVVGDAGWATVPFRLDPNRGVVLFWSNAREAHKWAEVVAVNPEVHQATLAQLLTEVLPMLTQRNCLVGYDWCTDPTDPVIEPSDLHGRIWRERTDSFLQTVLGTDTIWLLESASGPAMLPSQRSEGREFLPVWATRDAAAFNATGSWASKRPLGVTLAVFRDRYLPFLEQRGCLIGSEPIPGAGAFELSPSEFALGAFPGQALERLRAV